MFLYTNPPPNVFARLPHHWNRFSESADRLVPPILWATGLRLDKLHVSSRACVVDGSKLSCGEIERVLGNGRTAVLTDWKHRSASSKRKRSDAAVLGHLYDIQRVCHRRSKAGSRECSRECSFSVFRL